jgi:hypothetical protein
MAFVARYVRSTGHIDGIWESSTLDLLIAQIVGDDPTYGYLLSTDAAPTPLDHWWVQDGVLVSATELTITADVATFAADGVESCTLTVTPFVACTLLVNSVPWSLVPEDPALVLTTDVPLVFQVRLAPLAGYWAVEITVEAL